jgi:hypothetical protein
MMNNLSLATAAFAVAISFAMPLSAQNAAPSSPTPTTAQADGESCSVTAERASRSPTLGVTGGHGDDGRYIARNHLLSARQWAAAGNEQKCREEVAKARLYAR